MKKFTSITFGIIFILSSKIIKISCIFNYPPTIFPICGYRVNNTVPDRTVAEIHSPGFPNGYVGPHECTLTVSLLETTWIAFYVSHFMMRRPAMGCNDNFSIMNRAKPQNGTFRCGNITENNMLFTDSTFLTKANIDVRFHAKLLDADYNEDLSYPQRFVVRYTVADIIYPRQNYNHSKPIVNHEYGYIVSHSEFSKSGENRYDNNIDSYFTLTGLRRNFAIDLHFESIGLHNDGNCSDSLTITGLTEEPVLGEPVVICDNEADNTIYEVITISDSITFHFKTDDWSTSTGFKIKYYVHGLAASDEEYTTFSYPSTFAETETQSNPDNKVEVVTTAPTVITPNRTTTKSSTGMHDTDYMYLGVGIGANVFVAIIVIIIVVIIVRRRRQRNSQDKESRYTDSSQRTMPKPPSYKNRGIEYDDESSYYSEIGTYQKPTASEPTGVHYASRSICDTNFYHIVEEEPPADDQLTFDNKGLEPDYHLPYPVDTFDIDDTSPHGLNSVSLGVMEYHKHNWRSNHGSMRF